MLLLWRQPSVNLTRCSHTLGCSELAFGGMSLSAGYIKELRMTILLFQAQGDGVNTFPLLQHDNSDNSRLRSNSRK